MECFGRELHAHILKVLLGGVDSRFGCELATKWKSLWEGQSGYLMLVDTIRSLASQRA